MKNYLLVITISCFNISSTLTMENQIALSGSTSQFLGYPMVAYNKKVIFPVCGFKEPKTLFVKNNSGIIEQYSRDLHGEIGTTDDLKDFIEKSEAGLFIIRAFERSKQNVTCPNSFMIKLYSLAAQSGKLEEVKGTTQLVSREELLRSN